jgi:phosphate transport system substrate-binding protein
MADQRNSSLPPRQRAVTVLSRREALSVVAAGLAGAACGPSAMRSLRISGSNTVYTFAKELAVRFRQRRTDVSFRITGDGTSRGIKFAGEGEVQGLPAAFTNRNKFMAPDPAGGPPDTSNGERVDIGISSRALFQSEREAYSSMEAVPFAYDGLAVVTNRSVTVANLTIEQLRQIYAGMITNWSQVGGPSAPIVVIARDTLAGTAEAWSELVMNGLPVMATTMISMAEDVPAAVASMANSIAYLSLADINPMTMNPVSIEGVAPTIELVASGRYPIKRPFIFVTGARPTTVQAEFIDFAFSADGQAVIRSLNAVPATRGA